MTSDTSIVPVYNYHQTTSPNGLLQPGRDVRISTKYTQNA